MMSSSQSPVLFGVQQHTTIDLFYINNFLYNGQGQSRPFENWTKVNHSKTGHVQLSNPHWIQNKTVWMQVYTVTGLVF